MRQTPPELFWPGQQLTCELVPELPSLPYPAFCLQVPSAWAPDFVPYVMLRVGFLWIRHGDTIRGTYPTQWGFVDDCKFVYILRAALSIGTGCGGTVMARELLKISTLPEPGYKRGVSVTSPNFSLLPLCFASLSGAVAAN